MARPRRLAFARCFAITEPSIVTRSRRCALRPAVTASPAPTEACDGDDLRGQTCFDHGFVAGTLTCTADCTHDFAACSQGSETTDESGSSGHEPGPDPTTPTSGLDTPTTGDDPPPPSPEPTDSEDSVGAEQAEEGCGCRGSNAPAGLLALILMALRRRRVDSVASAGVR